MWRYSSGKKRPHDNWAYVLGVEVSRRRVVQVIGDRYFILMEFSLRQGVEVEEGQKVYVGRGPREEVSRFLRYLDYEELHPSARQSLEDAVRRILTEGEAFFIEFFNQAVPITRRLHQLELIPGVGKKMLGRILEAREERPFSSYSDLEERTGMKNPVSALAARVMSEISGKENYYIFVAPKTLLEGELF